MPTIHELAEQAGVSATTVTRILGGDAGVDAETRERVLKLVRELELTSDLSTAAVSGSSYENARLTIDLGRRCLFNMVVIDQGAQNETGYCSRLVVRISNNGINWYQVYAAAGTRRITYCPIVTPTMARYIRLVALVPGNRPWSVAEVYLQ